MPNSFTVPLIAGLAIAGTAAGVGLGRSAISEVNPSYFQDSALPAFHADLVANPPDWDQVQAREYAEAQVVTQDAPKPAGCVGCTTWPVDYVPRHDPTVDRAYIPASDREYREARQAASTTVVAYAPSPPPQRDRIVRYASYPVTREDEAQADQDAPSDPAPAEDYAATQ